MIETWTNVGGRIGNNMFQYAFTRLLAEELGYSFLMQPYQMVNLLKFFPKISAFVGGKTTIDTPDHFLFGELTILQMPGIQMSDIAKILREDAADQKITTCGQWERSYFYEKHKEKIKSWFKLESPARPIPHAVLNIRGGDLKEHTVHEIGYFHRALKHIGPNAAIVTDDPEWDEVQAFGLPIIHTTPLDDFKMILGAKQLVIGRSTFSWWGAFLGNAELVVQPEPTGEQWRSKMKYHYGYLGIDSWVKEPL